MWARLSLVVCLILSLEVSGQVVPIDSLTKSLLRKDLAAPKRIEVLNLLARELIFIAPYQAIEFAEEALELSKTAKVRAGEAEAYRLLGAIYSYKSYFATSALFTDKGLAIFTELGDSLGISNCFVSIGHNFKQQHDFIRAIQYHSLALKYFEKHQVLNRLPIAYINLGECLILSGQVEKGQQMARTALKLAWDAKNALAVSTAYRTLGMSYFTQSKFDSATYYFQKVKVLADSVGIRSQKFDLIQANIYLASIQLKGRKPEAIENIRNAIFLSGESGFSDELRRALKLEIDYNSTFRQYPDLINSVNRYTVVTDSLLEVIDEGQTELMEKISSVQRMEVENSKLNTQLAQNEATIRDQRNQLLLIILLSIFAIAFLGFIVFFYRERGRYSVTLLHQNKIIAENSRRLEELNTTKDKFFSVVSHDLRSPFNTLRSFVMLLENHLETVSREELLKLVGDMKRSLEVTSVLAENLITWARLQMNTEEVNARSNSFMEVVGVILDLYADEIKRKELKISVEASEQLKVLADTDHLAFILRNLVSNAVKFTPRGGTINISGEIQEQFVVITVADSGIGMPAEVRDNLFVIGKTRSRRGTAGERGSGLGLLLAYDFARKNGGTLSVESEDGRGTTFTVSLPVGN